MRPLNTALLLPLAFTRAIQLPSFQSFTSAFPIGLDDYIPPSYSNNASVVEDHDLLRRQYSNTCPDDFKNCANLGAPGLCCASAAVCSPDAAGHVACCPSGVACSGTIGGVITEGTVNTYGSLISGSTRANGGGATTTSSFVFAGSTTQTTTGLVVANPSSTTNKNGGFVVDGSSTVALPAAAVRGVEVVRIALIEQRCEREY